MKRMSPPTGVHASPVATPGIAVRSATSFSNFVGPRISARSPSSIFTVWTAPSAIRTAARHLALFLLRVARQLDDLHAVAQGARNRVEHVRRGDEEHARKVVGHREVVV